MDRIDGNANIISGDVMISDTQSNDIDATQMTMTPTTDLTPDINGTETNAIIHPNVDLLSDSGVVSANEAHIGSCNDGTILETADVFIPVEKTDNDNAVPPQDDGSGSNALNGALENGALKLSLSDKSDNSTIATTLPSTLTLDKEKSTMDNGDIILIQALQENLQHQMSLKAEAEDKVRKMEAKVGLLEDQIQKQANEMLKLDTIQENLQLQMNAKAEAEHKARSAYDRVQQLETKAESKMQELQQIQQQLSESRDIIDDKDRELDKVRNERDEYERKITALTTRLNAAKKLEAVKVNHVDEIEDDLKITSDELQKVKLELEQNKSAKRILEERLQYVEKVSREQIELLESSVAEEKRLNEERKMKMKYYVEKKTEELRQSKEENDSLQMELTQTNHSLVDLNTRWKQIHTQWVQAQTRNRELQRDLQRTKKDSEHLHKQGDTLEMKLSRSANETEEHKNKRLAAKQELMSVLRALEIERDVTTKLRDQIKFTFVPKMLHQQQTLTEIMQELTSSLEKLSIRLVKPLLALPEEPERDEVSGVTNTNGSHHDGTFSQADINPLVEKLDHESQKVSSAIAAVSNNVERLRALVHAGGDRTCLTVLSELVNTGGMQSSPAVQADRARTQLQAAIGRSHRYGQIPGTSD